MPLYEYVCQDCRHEFETLVQTGEEVACPQCQGDHLDRLFSVPGVPRVNTTTSLPMSCNPNTPPCGPGCCKL
jgi:putative FmdB family regulatory protein